MRECSAGGLSLEAAVIAGHFALCRRDVANRDEEAVVIEPPEPSQSNEFDVIRPTGTPMADHLCLVKD